MRPYRIALAVASLAVSLQAADAMAVTCYEIIDGNQVVNYRSTEPPFAMDGAEWTRQQDLLRAKGLHLRWQTMNDCGPRLRPTGVAPGERKKIEGTFDPDVILRGTPEYMTASGRPSSVGYSPGK